MSAKFIAQIEISKPWVSNVNRPAEAIRPTIVKSSGRPAATSEPKASTRIAIVTGHEKSSDFIIALRFAALKSDHIPEAPVRLTDTPGDDERGPAVARDRDARPRRHDRRDEGVGTQDRLRLRDGRTERGRARRRG